MNNFSLKNLSPSELMQNSKKYLFSTGMNDGASRLARENTIFGLAKMHYAQEALGFRPSAFFVSTPDETITRNAYRWAFGSGYGGKYCWGSGKDKLIFPDLKPNSCGMITGALDCEPDIEKILGNIDSLMNNESRILGIDIEWDFKDSNHFIDIFKLKYMQHNRSDEEFSKNYFESIDKISKYDYFFIIHCSAPEMKKQSPGMYIDSSKELYNMCEHIKTPLGACNALIDDNALKYYDFLKKANEFSNSRRILAAKKIFDNFKLISNQNHQGMISGMNEMYLGANDSSKSQITPIALNADASAYLVNGLNNFSEEMIESLGWTKKAKKSGAYKKLLNSNIMPHGGGYALKGIANIKEVKMINNERYFTCGMQNTAGSRFIFKNPKELEFYYRGKEVVQKSSELGLCQILAVLEPWKIIKL